MTIGIVLAVVAVVLYASLSIFKAHEYTSTPSQASYSTSPRDHGLDFTDVSFDAADTRGMTLFGWWMEAPEHASAVVLVHGRYQNRTAMIDLAIALVDRGHSVLAFDLRGHGRSDPSSYFYGLRERYDVIGAVRWVESRGFARESVAVVGWSLGATSALMALPELEGLSAVVSDSAYVDDSPLLARNALRPGLKLAMRLTRDVDLARVRPLDDVTVSNVPMLVIHGEGDQAVPVAHAYRLSRAASDDSDLWIVPRARHIGGLAIDHDEYVARIDRFLRLHVD